MGFFKVFIFEMHPEDILIKLSDGESVETRRATDVMTVVIRGRQLYLCVHHTMASTSV